MRNANALTRRSFVASSIGLALSSTLKARAASAFDEIIADKEELTLSRNESP